MGWHPLSKWAALQEKLAARQLFVLRRDLMRVKTTCRLMAKTKATSKNDLQEGKIWSAMISKQSFNVTQS